MDLEMDLAMHQFSKVRTWVHHQDFSYFLWFSFLLSMKDLAFLAMDLEMDLAMDLAMDSAMDLEMDLAMVMVMVLAITSLAIHTQQSGLPPGRFLTSWRRLPQHLFI